MGIRVSPTNAVALGGDLLGTGSTVAAPRVGSITGVAGVMSVRSGSAIAFDGGATVAAASGLIRLPTTANINVRNAANLADISLVYADGSDSAYLGPSTSNYLRVYAGAQEFRVGAADRFTLNAALATFNVSLQFGTIVAAPTIDQLTSTTGNGKTLTVRAQNSLADANPHDGGLLVLSGGLRNSTGAGGGVRVQINNGGSTMVEAADLGNNVRRVVALCRANVLASADAPTGDLVVHVGNAAVLPSSDPTNGGLLYADAGAGKWRGTGGTVTTFGPAEPHCPRCARDYVFEARNEVRGEHLAICWACFADEAEEKGLDVARFAFHRVLRAA